MMEDDVGRAPLGQAPRRPEAGDLIEAAAPTIGPIGVPDHGPDARRHDPASQALQSAKRFQAAVRAIDGVLWTADAQGELVGEQPGWTALTGQTWSDYRDGGGFNALHPDDVAPTRAAWRASIAERRPFAGEHRLRCADGTWRRFSVRAVPVLGDDGEIEEWVGVHTDITAQHEREAQLCEREERLRAALEASGTGTFRWDLASNTLDWDEALDRLFGLPPGRTARSLDQFLALVHPDDRDEVSASCAACRDVGVDFEMAYRVVHPSGEVRWLYDRGRAYPGPDGKPAAITGACVDVTERRKIEDELRKSESRFRKLTEALPSFVFVANQSGENIYTNPTYQRGVGRSAEELNGFGYLDIIHPQDGPQAMANWRRATQTGSAYETEARLQMADGTHRWHLIKGLPLMEAGGSVTQWFGTITDIQDMVDARESLTRSNIELEALVSRRTGEVAHLQKQEAIGRLTGGVAHDFNNLLTPIMGTLDLLQRREGQDPRTRRMIEGALQAADRAKTLVARLLAFARRQHLDVAVVDLGALVEGMRELIDRSIGPTIAVEVRCAADLPPVRVDPNQLELALLNLAVNARDAMPDGGRLTIEAAIEQIGPGLSSKPPPGDYVRLTVLDTGTGMDEATLVRAVEPFFSTKGLGEGTGLGLSMVHGLAAQSGGALVLASQPGAGTRADIYLPGAHGAAPLAQAQTGAAHRPPLHGVKILLVDDDDAVRRTTAQMLEESGCIVRHAGSAAEAVAAVEAGLEPAVLITDYLMPGANGADLGRALRARLPGLPVLILSGYSRSTEALEFPRVQKPFRAKELADAVASLFIR